MKTLVPGKILSWVIFAAGSTLTWIIYTFMTGFGQYYELLSILGVLTFGFGIWVLQANAWTRRAIIIVVIGLLLGQWWFLEFSGVNVLWTIHGFAP